MNYKIDLGGKRVLVTGGAGFIGSHTTEALLAAGATVVVFDNFTTGKRGNLPQASTLQIIQGDVRDFVALRAALEGVDAVMHLAAQVSVRASVQDPVNSSHHNVIGFVNVLQAMREVDVPRLVYASSAAVYGMPARLPLDESSAVRPISPYGLEKLINEQYAQLFSALYGTSCLGLRYFNVYGPRQDPSSPYAGVISKFVEQLRAGQPLRIFGSGRQTRDFVYVRDIAWVNAAAVANDRTGVVPVGTGRSVTLLDLVHILTQCAGCEANVIHESPVVGDILCSEMSPALLRDCFDWVPSTSLDEGLRQLLQDIGNDGATKA